MPFGARSLAVGASVALHAAVAATLLLFAREPIQRALQARGGAVEVGVVFSEPRRPAAPVGPSAGEGVAAPAPQPKRRPSNPVAPRPMRAETAPAPGAAPPPLAVLPSAPPQASGGIALPPADPAGEGAAAESGGGAGAAGEGGDGTGEGAGDGEAEGSALATGGGGEAGGPDVDQELRTRLAASAARCYPRAAQRFRAEGTARVRFCVAEDGRARDEEIVESSGQRLLDDAALRCVIARAAPFPRTASCFTVPIHFYVP